MESHFYTLIYIFILFNFFLLCIFCCLVVVLTLVINKWYREAITLEIILGFIFKFVIFFPPSSLSGWNSVIVYNSYDISKTCCIESLSDIRFIHYLFTVKLNCSASTVALYTVCFYCTMMIHISMISYSFYFDVLRQSKIDTGISKELKLIDKKRRKRQKQKSRKLLYAIFITSIILCMYLCLTQ